MSSFFLLSTIFFKLEEEWRKLAAGESAVSAEKLGQWLGGTAAAGQIVLDAICQHLGGKPDPLLSTTLRDLQLISFNLILQHRRSEEKPLP